jgi:hypothetical protein
MAANPLTSKDRENLAKALANLNNVIPLLDQAEAAGLDMTEARMRRDDLYRRIEQLYNTFFEQRQ